MLNVHGTGVVFPRVADKKLSNTPEGRPALSPGPVDTHLSGSEPFHLAAWGHSDDTNGA